MTDLKYEHIAVSPSTKKRFEYLRKFLMTPNRPKITHDDLLLNMMELFQKKYEK